MSSPEWDLRYHTHGAALAQLQLVINRLEAVVVDARKAKSHNVGWVKTHAHEKECDQLSSTAKTEVAKEHDRMTLLVADNKEADAKREFLLTLLKETLRRRQATAAMMPLATSIKLQSWLNQCWIDPIAAVEKDWILQIPRFRRLNSGWRQFSPAARMIYAWAWRPTYKAHWGDHLTNQDWFSPSCLI